MTTEERLYDAFGELLYVIAMADGIVQDEEVTELERILAEHPWAKTIRWSFDYERTKHSDREEVYKKVIDFCHHYGPSPVYNDFISAMQALAGAANGIDANEENTISAFSTDLIARFQHDLDHKINKN